MIISSPSSFSAHMAFFPRGPFTLSPLPRSARQPPAQPRAPAARPSSRASLASRAEQPPTPPRPAADCPGPPVSAGPNLPRPRSVSHNHRRTTPAPRASWARRPHLGLVLKEPDPARIRLLSPLSLSRSPSTEEPAIAAAVISELRRPPLRADSLLRAASVSISPLVSFAVLPSISRYPFFSFLLASRALAASSAGHGRRPWRPPR